MPTQNLCRKKRFLTFHAAIGLALCPLLASEAATVTWSSSGGSAWLTTSNWQGGNAPGTGDIAEFDANPTGTGQSNGVGVNFGNPVNNGTFTGVAGTLGDQAVGAISVTAARTASSLYIGNTKNSPSGYMTLNGATLNGQANVILSNSSQKLVIQNEVQSSSGSTFGLVLGGTVNNVLIAAGTSSIVINSTIDQVNAGSSITLLGNGNSSVQGGTLELGGVNSFTGGITAGASNGTQGGTVQIDGAASLASSGNILINNNSELLLPNSGTYGSAGQNLTLNGEGPASGATSGALRVTGASVTWQGNVSFGSNSYITPTTGNTLTFTGSVTDSGYQLQKQGGGALILATTANNMTGSTQIGNGALTVNSGATLGTGYLQMAQSSTNSTVLTMNNATQTVGNLSSSFAATTGTETQVITLSPTALTIIETGSTTFGNGIISGTISQTSTITGNGSVILGAASTGALTLTGTQTYTGGTQINGGTLFVNGALFGSTATVNETGGALSGAGVIGGLVTVSSGGTITTGSGAGAAGVLTLQNGLNLSGGGDYAWNLETLNDNTTGVAGTDFDQIALTSGTLTLGGSSQLTLGFSTASPNSGNVFWLSNHTWTVISGVAGTGNFSAITDPTYTDGTFSVADSSGIVTLSYLTTVPEPSAVLSMGVGAVSLLGWRRKRRQK